MKEFFNYLDKLNALEDVPFDLDSQWESKPKNEGKRIVKKSAKLNENYGHDGYMYITKHGLGPGTLPKDAHLLRWKDLPHYMTAIWLDRFLTTDELNQYDIYPETQIRRVMDMYDITEDDIMGESVKAKRKTGSKALKEELSDIKQEWEDFLSRGGNNVIEFDDGDYVFFGVDFDKGTIYAGSATNTGIIREYEINLDSDLNLDENIAELYDEICREKEQVDESVKIKRKSNLKENKRKSNLKENKRLVEGPGAGYTIEGQLSDIQIHDFTFSVNDDIVTVNCNIDAISKDTEAHSYYYGDIIGKVPVTISKVQYYVYYAEEDNIPDITEDGVREDLKYYLDGIKYEALIGGGWSHTTFDGNIIAEKFKHYNGEDSDVIYLEMKCKNIEDIDTIEDAVTGANLEDEEDYIEESLEDTGLTKTTLKAIKKGTYFTFKPVEDPSENIVYVKDEYDRESRKYGYYKWSDTNNWHEKKGDTVVYTGFTF